ncbi:unnamed protein product [Brassicogethes aeneus]|uniref:Carbonic anhydrase n=1 Tax=Brassicogethes aeneus TaxID=1431903 RepID=A0A9P0FJ43_BRAAE|nr:unnamed protein product [Brassicogethes aeneus]
MFQWTVFCINIIIVLLSTDVTKAQDGHWSFDDVENWPRECQTGKFQSPIDIGTGGMFKKYYPRFRSQNFYTYQSATIGNNGHTVNITFSNTITVYGGGLPAPKYQLDNIHFHWRSEHTVNHYRYPLEIHLVLYDAQYPNFQEALANKGVAVLGVLVEECSDYFNTWYNAWDVIKNQMSEIEKVGTITQLNQRILISNFLPYNTRRFVRYSGSLTTPDCNEGIIWTVFTNTICIPSHQLNALKQIRGEDGKKLDSTYRPVQPLNGRIVTLSKNIFNFDAQTNWFKFIF